jgi:hypothetical protein
VLRMQPDARSPSHERSLPRLKLKKTALHIIFSRPGGLTFTRLKDSSIKTDCAAAVSCIVMQFTAIC